MPDVNHSAATVLHDSKATAITVGTDTPTRANILVYNDAAAGGLYRTTGTSGAGDVAKIGFNTADIGSTLQAYFAGLQSIGGLTTSADQMLYTTASNTYATTTITSYARTLIDDIDAAAARTTLGLTIGTNVQAYSAILAALVSGYAAATVGDVFKKDGSNGAWSADSGGSGSTTFVGLTDTPANYTSSGGFAVRVNAGATGLEFTAFNSTLVGLGNVPNVDATNAANISDGTLNNARLSAIPLTTLATQANNTINANFSGGTASPSAIAIQSFMADFLRDTTRANAIDELIQTNALALTKLAQVSGFSILGKPTTGTGNVAATVVSDFIWNFLQDTTKTDAITELSAVLGALVSGYSAASVGHVFKKDGSNGAWGDASLPFTVVGFGKFGYRSAVLTTDFISSGSVSRTSGGRYFYTFSSTQPDTNYAVFGNATFIRSETAARSLRGVQPRNETTGSVELYCSFDGTVEDMQSVTFLVIRSA